VPHLLPALRLGPPDSSSKHLKEEIGVELAVLTGGLPPQQTVSGTGGRPPDRWSGCRRMAAAGVGQQKKLALRNARSTAASEAAVENRGMAPTWARSARMASRPAESKRCC